MYNWTTNGLQVNEGQPSVSAVPRFKFNRFCSSNQSLHLPHGFKDSDRLPTLAMINTAASLEDCHTNVLALTELSGLKWRRLTTLDSYQYGNDLDQDPILSAYSRCVRENILCTWRRRQRQQEGVTQIENVTLRLDTPKELWIFWYTNDEPEIIKTLEKENNLTAPDDTEFPDSTIKYETRTQFFKALHNVIEKNMLNSGYLRFGRWFTRPLDEFAVSPDCAMPAYINGLRFEFSVQGENHACVAVKTQCQPPILRLSPKHLRSNNKSTPVILAPWSIRAQLLPQQPLRELQHPEQITSSFNSSGFSLLNASIQQQQTQLPEEIQNAVEEQWNQWSAMLSMVNPMTDDQNEQNENVAPSSGKQSSEKLPRFVAVEVDGTRMFYPSCFIGIVVQDTIDQGNKTDQRGLADDLDLNDILVGFSQESQLDLLEIQRQKMLAVKKKETYVPELLRHNRKSNIGVRIGRRSFEDGALSAPIPLMQAPSTSNSNASVPPTLQRVKTETGLHLNMPSTSGTNASTNTSDDLRWNYFDYLRKEYCYCAMCSAGGNQVESRFETESKSTKQLGQPSTSSAPFIFHHSNFNDRLGGYGTDPNLFSPPQNPQKVASPEQTQKELDFLRQLDEKERNDHSEPKVPIFARTIATDKRTAIPSDRLNFASVQDCNFNNLYKCHLDRIGYPMENRQQDVSDEFEPFTPITCVTPDPEATQDFNSQWSERIRNFNYPYHPQKTDFITEESYHVKGQRNKPIGPRLKPSSESANETPVHLIDTPVQATTSILKSLLDAPDDEDEITSCFQPMQKRGTSPNSIRKEDEEWQSYISEALQSRKQVPTRRWMSEKEAILRRQWSSQQNLQRQSSSGEETNGWSRQANLLKDRSRSTSELHNEGVHSALRERLLSPSMSINLSRSVQSIEEPMETDQLHSNFNQAKGSLQQKSDSQQNVMLDPISMIEEAELADKGPTESLFYGENVKKRYFMCENAQAIGRPLLKNIQPGKGLSKADDEYPTLRRLIQEDLVEAYEPKTPISNLNSSIANHLAYQAPHLQQDLQQMFTSSHSNDVHSILSPPASNEQVDGNPLTMQQQHTPGDKNQPLQPQTLVHVGQTNLALHSSGWNTSAVSANNIHDSLNVIYPTPPTPLQQYSPLNAHPILAEDPQAKRRRLVDEYSEPEQDEENEPVEQNESSQSTKTINKFLSVENLAADLLKLKAPTLPVFAPQKVEWPPHSERFIGDLLDEKVDDRRKTRWLKHMKNESDERLQKLKENLKKRTARKEIVFPPEYVCQFKARRLMMPNRAQSIINPNDKKRLARNAIELPDLFRKPINGYGNTAVVRLNNAYLNKKRQWEQQSFASKQDGQLMRQYSTGNSSNMFPNQAQNQQMMMYGQQGGANRQFNPYLVQQNSFGNNGGPMTPQMINSQMMNPSMQMGRPGQFGNQQMHPNVASPGYPSNMQQGNNFQRMPGSVPRYSTPGQQQQPSQQQMLGYFSNPSPASSLGSNPSQLDQQQLSQGQQRSIGSVPGMGQQHHTLPFGSPGIPINNLGGSNFQRTPSMPPSVTANNFDAASNANQSVFSVEGPASALHGQRSQADQARIDGILSLFQNCRSRLIAVLMKDTILDLHYDSVFDACPICSCNGNIRSAELGLYVKVPDIMSEVIRIQQRQQTDSTFKVDYWNGLMLGNSSVQCSCGFSAVRHRFLCSDGRGLFGDDVQEAGITLNQFKGLNRGNERSYSKKRMLNELMDCLRFLSINRNLAVCFKQAYYIGDFPTDDPFIRPSQLATNPQNTNYVMSRVDVEEFDPAVRSVVQVARGNFSGITNERTLKKPVFHPWGFQIASQTREPKDQECLAVVREVQCVLERSMKEVRGIDSANQTNIVEGPLTWRSFYRKAVKSSQEDDSYKPEQIPQILVSADRDPIATNPQLIHMWEKLSLSPYDQSKDVLYLAVVPDSNVIVEKCKVFLEELSTLYEKSRFGRHVRLSTKDAPRDGIIRVNMKSHSAVNAAAQGLGANSKFNEEDRKLHLRISVFCEQILAELKAVIVNNESIFERRAYYETLYRDSLQPNYTSLATSTDSNYMPPPAVPMMIQSPPSILSTASGPASQPLNPMSNPTPTPTSLFSAQNTNQLPSPALSTGDNLMEPLRTPEVSVGTPGEQQQTQQQAQTPSQHLTQEAIEKAVDEMLLEDHALSLPHVIVIYLVNPFTFGSEACSSRVARSAGLFLMKTFNSLLSAMSSRKRPQIQIELINLQTLYDYTSFVADPLREERQYIDDTSRQDKPTAYDCLRRVAFSVYSQTRLVIPEHVKAAIPSSMTRFGPASSISDIFDELQRREPPLYFKVPTMPFVLAPTEVIGVETANNKIRLLNPLERVLFVAYCLPSDDFLCAAVTDQYGHLADNVIINLHVDQPTNQLRYKNRSQIFDAIQRLWLYIQSVLFLETRNWRLVINRVGKIGHGEFKAWTHILSKNSLRSFNNSFKGRDRGDGLMSAGLDSASSASNCRTCQLTAGTQEIPIILSACLLSMEAEPNLRLFTSSSNSSDLASALGKSKGSTKNGIVQAQIVDDPSITHIVAFPISPDIVEAQHGGNQQAGQEDENIFDELNFNDLMQDEENLDALMGNTEFGDGNREDTTIDHQPMAVGYSVSTAPANDLPDWFWSTCPSTKSQLPVHLKNALHINASNIHDELSIGQKTSNETFHPLDDSATDALLRYIMKTHNALSWLNVDVANGTRQSCLPVHIQTLFRLQRSIDTIYS